MSAQIRRPVVLGSIAALAVLFILGMSFQGAINRQLHSWKVLPEPERLTELYFADPNHLPASYAPGQTQTVAFTVHNLEYRTTTYHYVISAAPTGQTGGQALTSGSFTLPQGSSKTSVVNVIVPDTGSRATVSVNLEGQNESIDYLVGKEGV